MSYKCIKCGAYDVENEGDICEVCMLALGGPAAQGSTAAQKKPKGGTDVPVGQTAVTGKTAGGSKGRFRHILVGGTGQVPVRSQGGDVTAQDPVTQDPVTQTDAFVSGQVSTDKRDRKRKAKAGAKVNTAKLPLTKGIVKNVALDDQPRSILYKWFRSLFTGVPFTLDNDVNMFQVFPDYSGGLNALGNACDQVKFYGRITNGSICENNEVEVYGRRDSHNNIIAKQIRNVASGTLITPQRAMSAVVVRILTLFILLGLAAVISGLGVKGLILAAVIALLLTNLPLVFKIIGVVFGLIISLIGSIFGRRR